ncbi:MAG: MCP four helix bundle domain-containing protein [Lachnospiraceae bacterium]|nr:MCP four helix bundle domain-containing protein [Lachnospiraceae bacterium]MBR6666604.1 MCP four helix bundle domain-containing protein [Lachnospiraceae bacterium]
MKNTKNMQVNDKLKRSFILVVSIANIAAILAAGLMLIIDARYSKALELNGFIQGDLGEYSAYLNRDGALSRDIIMLTDASELAEAQKDLQTTDEKINYYFNEFEHKLETDEEKALTALIKEKYPKYIEERDKAISDGMKNHNEAALQQFRDNAIPILREVMDATEQLIAMNREMGDKVSDRLIIFSIVMVVFVFVVIAIAVIIAMRLASATSKEINTSVEKIQKATKKLAKGELDVRVQIETGDEFEDMAKDFNEAVDNLHLYIDTIKYGLTEVGAGNFAVKPPIEFVGDFVALKDAIVHITEALSSTMREINDGSEQVALGAEQLAENAQMLAEGATTQAAAIEELTATIENVTNQAEFSARQADEACKSAQSFANLAEQSSRELVLLTEAMMRITETSKKIENIIAEIEDIASQTNLLSLNASIEAARAGESGRGFAVVADQIGKLAADSAQSAVNTNTLIKESLQEISEGNAITANTVSALQELIEGIRALAEAAQQSRELSAEQAVTMEQVQQGVIQIADVVQNNSASAEETSATSEELSAQSQNLKAMVEQFQLLEG